MTTATKGMHMKVLLIGLAGLILFTISIIYGSSRDMQTGIFTLWILSNCFAWGAVLMVMSLVVLFHARKPHDTDPPNLH